MKTSAKLGIGIFIGAVIIIGVLFASGLFSLQSAVQSTPLQACQSLLKGCTTLSACSQVLASDGVVSEKIDGAIASCKAVGYGVSP